MAKGEAAKEAARGGQAAPEERLQPEPLDAVALQLVAIQATLSGLQGQVQSALVLVQMQLGRRAVATGTTPATDVQSEQREGGRQYVSRETMGLPPRRDPARTFMSRPASEGQPEQETEK